MAGIVRSANAVWEGDLKGGKGTMKMQAWEGPFSFTSRFENGNGTNPEELLAAAHAGCYSMAFSNELSKAGFVPTRMSTVAKVHMENATIHTIELEAEGVVPGIDQAKFLEIAEAAKKGCPVSKLFTGTQIKLQAKLIK